MTTTEFCGKCGSERMEADDLYCRGCGNTFAGEAGVRASTLDTIQANTDRTGWSKTNAASITSAVILCTSGFFSLVGAILPWANAPFGVSKTGIEGDGMFTLIAGLMIVALAAALVFRGDRASRRWIFSALSMLLSGFILFVAVIDIRDANGIIAGSHNLIKLGPGIYLTTVSGSLGIVGALVGFASGRPWDGRILMKTAVGALVLLGLASFGWVAGTAVVDYRGTTNSMASPTNTSGPNTSVPAKLAEGRVTDVADLGRGHFAGAFVGHQMTPFCESVPSSASAKHKIVGGGGAPNTAASSVSCYNSNPPSSGKHLNVQRSVDVGGGNIINIPADPDVYPDDVEIPRDAIPHILEHAGVFVGWNCETGDTACAGAAQKLKYLVNNRIDNHDNRVVMAHDNDLPEGTFGLASWTRVLDFPFADWDQEKALADQFISTNSCRFDPEGFCP